MSAHCNFTKCKECELYPECHQKSFSELTDQELLMQIFVRNNYSIKQSRICHTGEPTLIVDNSYGQLLHFDFDEDGNLEDCGCLIRKTKAQ